MMSSILTWTGPCNQLFDVQRVKEPYVTPLGYQLSLAKVDAIMYRSGAAIFVTK